MRYLFIISILTLSSSYVMLRLTNYFKISTSITNIIITVFLISFQAIGLSRLQIIEHFSTNSSLTINLYKTSYILLGIVQYLFFYMLLIDIVKFILHTALSDTSPIYVKFCNISLPAAVITTLLTTIIGFMTVINGPVVETVEITLNKLPKSFDGFTIAQISDLHVGSTIKRDYVEKVVNMTNNLKPNLIALTGDFVDGDTINLKNDVAPLAELKSTHGTFFVSGNHEYYSGIEQWLTEFSNLGIINLINEHVLITQQQDHIVLAGVTDYSTAGKQVANASDPLQAAAGAPVNLVKILLAHQPTSYIKAKQAGFDLQLSGHTHGGQFFPLTFLMRFFHQYYKGLNYHKGMWIYINKGTGYWGPPIRVGSSPELTLIVLRSL